MAKQATGIGGVDIDIDNSELVKKLTAEQIEKALIDIGVEVQRSATLLAPTDTGRLKGSINYSTHTQTGTPQGSKASKAKDSRPKGVAEETFVYIGTNVEYAVYVEMGHTTPTGKHVSAQPYLEPAIRNNVEKIKEIFADKLGELDNK